MQAFRGFMIKPFYISLCLLALVASIDIISYQNSPIQLSIDKLEKYIDLRIDDVYTEVKSKLKKDLFKSQQLDIDQLNEIKQLESQFKKEHISVQIRESSSLIAWLNNTDHNTICKSYRFDQYNIEVCLNPFDKNLKVFNTINHNADLAHQFVLDNPGKESFAFFDKHISSTKQYRSKNLSNLLLAFYFCIFLYFSFSLITSNLFIGFIVISISRLLLLFNPQWHQRYDNSIFLEQLLDWQQYCTVDLLFDSIIIFLLLSASSAISIKKTTAVPNHVFNILHAILISLLIVSHIRLIQILSFSDRVNLSINDLSKIQLSGIVVFLSILIIQAGIFIYAVNFIKTLKSNNNKKALYYCLALCTTATSIMIYAFQMELNVFFTFLFFMSFFLLLDLFLDVKSKSITWIIWWGIFFGVYLSSLFFNYDIKKEITERSQLLKQSFIDVPKTQIDSLVVSGNLAEIGQSLSELLILPDEANYDKLDIISYLKKKHGEQNIRIDILHKTGKNYFNELGDISLFDKQNDNYLFDNIENILWHVHQHQDSLTLYTGVVLTPSQLNSIPYLYIKGNKSQNQNLLISKSELDHLLKIEESHYFSNSNAYIKYKISEDSYIISKKSFKSIVKPVALFSFLFSVIIILVIIIGFIGHWISFISNTWPYTFKGAESLNSKIQIALILVILLSFILIAFITSSFLKSFIDNKNESYLTEQLETLSRDINSRVGLANSAEEAYAIGTNYKSYIENIHNVNLSFNALSAIEFQQEYFPYAYFSKYNKVAAFSSKDSDGNLLSYIPFKFNNELVGFIKVSNRSKSYQELNVFDFLGSIFNVYVFLFLIASVLAVLIARSITKPLSILNQKLSQLKFGKRNELITWEAEDEIGTLINNYNTMVNQLEDSAQLLAKTERDSAWREMAKQVAHEIKNPLTPMKMYIQHLEKAIKQRPEDASDIAKRISKTLLEQVDNLTQIANSFGNFAELPQSSNEKIELNTVVEVVHNLFRKRDDMDIKLSEPIDTIFVYADKNQLIRILNNLVKNATEAIPKDRVGRIHLHLYKEENVAFIKVTDNGMGIPENMRDKVFQPKFTTKDSGSGLGLAIALNMIESMNGRLYFESEENVGTSFIIELDIIRENINDNKERIILE